MFGRNLFRQKAIDRLAAPEELDRLLVVVKVQAWMPLAILGGLCIVALVWSVLGRIPVTVNGMGVLINPGNVRGLQSQATGQLIELPLRVGQEVKKADVIGVLNQPELRKQIEQAEAKRNELIEYDQTTDKLDAQRWELEQKSDDVQRKFLHDEIDKLRELTTAVIEKDRNYNAVQRENLNRTKELSQKLHQSLETQFHQIRALKSEGLAAGPLVLNTEREYTESQLRVANIEVQLRELDLREIEGAENHLKQENRISDLMLQLRQLEIHAQRLRQQLLESNTQRENQISDCEREIERLKLDLERQSTIRSEYTGRILEIAVSSGQIIRAGERLGSIEIDDPKSELRNLAYFQVKDGKRIRQAMQVYVTPSTVQRERYGAIIGQVTKVSAFPITREGAANIVGNQEVAAALTAGGGMIEVEATLERDHDSFSGYRWTSQGPPLRFSAGTTTTVRVTVEQRRPITFVLPIFRTWVLGAKDEDPAELMKKG